MNYQLVFEKKKNDGDGDDDDDGGVGIFLIEGRILDKQELVEMLLDRFFFVLLRDCLDDNI
eukprot:scaffold146_cov171-Ochromonas_danica.AAC.10